MARRRGKGTLQVVRIADGIARCRLTEGGQIVAVSCERLLAAEGGRGLHYRLAGYAKRRSGYRTVARLVAVDAGRALLCLPEWHPRRPVWLFADLLPGDARVGGWLSVQAHLDAVRPAHLQVHKLALCEPPEPELTARAELQAPEQASPEPASPAFGQGCGDIVLYAGEPLLERLHAPAGERWDRSVFVPPNRPPVSYGEGRDPTGLPAGRLSGSPMATACVSATCSRQPRTAPAARCCSWPTSRRSPSTARPAAPSWGGAGAGGRWPPRRDG